MKYFYLLLLTALTVYDVSAQSYNELRYRERIFTGSITTSDIQYGSAPQWVWPYWNEDLYVDVYQPVGDTLSKRPLVILAHAGGFLNGAKDVDDMVALCDSLARLGYVTASIEYRKGFNPLDNESAERAVYRGIQDGKAAVRYFKENAATYGVDTNFIYFGGMSAGGYISLHVAYMDLESERPASTYGGGTVNDLGCLDCAGNSYGHTSKVRAILDYWGAVQDTTIMAPGDIPVMIMHGENDPTVPFVYGYPFGLSTLPQTYGGLPISERAQHLGLDYEFYTSQGNLHMLDGSNNGTFDSSNPPNAFWYDTLLPRTEAFLYRMTKPYPQKVSPDTMIVCFGDPISLLVSGDTESYYKWTYDTQQTTAVLDDHSENLVLSFTNGGTYDVAVVEFNEVACASDTLWFRIIQQPELLAGFNFTIAGINDVTFTNTSSNPVSQHWNFGDGITATEENPMHTYTANGTYTVELIVWDDAGCSDTLEQQVSIQSLGLETNGVLAGVDVYPNPFSESLNIRNTSGEELEMVVTDLNGKIMITSTVSGLETRTLVTRDWDTGMYFVRVQKQSGEGVIYKVIR